MAIRNVGASYLSGSLTEGDLGGTPTAGAGLPEGVNCCWIITGTTGCTLSGPGVSASALPSNVGPKADCCWYLVATTGCTFTGAVEGAAPPASAADCCWVILATTGCTRSGETSASGASGARQAAASADCCWMITGTTGCTF
jgi:hypothetical protein